MKNNIIALILCIFITLPTLAQEEKKEYDFWGHKKSLRIGYTFHTLENSYGGKQEPDMAFNMARVHTFYLHKKAIANRLKFGIDLGFSVNYAKYGDDIDEIDYTGPTGFIGTESDYYEEDDEMIKIGIHQLDMGLKIGPSLTYNPVGNLRLVAYFHVTPSYSAMLNDGDISSSFVPFFDTGMEISYRWFGLGAEITKGVGKYKSIVPESSESEIELPKNEYGTNSVRVYLAFRF